jgi:hypothetical protein
MGSCGRHEPREASGCTAPPTKPGCSACRAWCPADWPPPKQPTWSSATANQHRPPPRRRPPPWRTRPTTSPRHWTGWTSRPPTPPSTGSSRPTPSRRSCRRSSFRTCKAGRPVGRRRGVGRPGTLRRQPASRTPPRSRPGLGARPRAGRHPRLRPRRTARTRPARLRGRPTPPRLADHLPRHRQPDRGRCRPLPIRRARRRGPPEYQARGVLGSGARDRAARQTGPGHDRRYRRHPEAARHTQAQVLDQDPVSAAGSIDRDHSAPR